MIDGFAEFELRTAAGSYRYPGLLAAGQILVSARSGLNPIDAGTVPGLRQLR